MTTWAAIMLFGVVFAVSMTSVAISIREGLEEIAKAIKERP